MLQVILQCSQAPLRAHTIRVGIGVGHKAWLVFIHTVVGHMNTPPPVLCTRGVITDMHVTMEL